MAGIEVPWSALQRKSAMPRMLAMVRYCGPPSLFVTVAPSDADSMLMLRISAVMTTGSSADVERLVPAAGVRRRTAAENPVATALMTKLVLEAIMEDLIGLRPAHMRLATVPLHDRPLGIFGRIIGYVFVTEEQARGSLHAHAVLFTDMSPITLAASVDDALQSTVVCERIDSIVRATLPFAHSDEVVMSSLPCAEPTPLHRDARNEAPTPLADRDGFDAFVLSVTRSTNVHGHSFTCHKGAQGQYRCRLHYPRAPWRHPTRLVQLWCAKMADGTMGKPVALVAIMGRDDDDVKAALADPMLAWRDSRMIVVELYRASPLTPQPQEINGAYCDIEVESHG